MAGQANKILLAKCRKTSTPLLNWRNGLRPPELRPSRHQIITLRPVHVQHLSLSFSVGGVQSSEFKIILALGIRKNASDINLFNFMLDKKKIKVNSQQKEVSSIMRHSVKCTSGLHRD